MNEKIDKWAGDSSNKKSHNEANENKLDEDI